MHRYIINPDAVHHLFLLEFKMAYPDAKVIGVEETIKRMNEKSFPFDGRAYLLSIRVIAVHDLVSLGPRPAGHEVRL